jgi:hypothetical protein
VAGEKHLYLVVGGAYEDSSDSPEAWQFGIRLALVFGSVDDHGTLPTNWDVTDTLDSGTDGNWDVVQQFAVDGPLTETFNPRSYLADYVEPTLEAFFGTGTTSAQVKLKTLKLSPINDSGHVIESRTTLATANTDIHGDAGGSIMPLQCSVCASWETPVVGRKGRGRIYLPPVVVGVLGSHGRLDPSWVGDAATNVKALLEGLSYSGVGAGTAHVRPIVTGAPWTDYGMITEVRVGDLVDTQRRRRRQLVETYTSETPSYG